MADQPQPSSVPARRTTRMRHRSAGLAMRAMALSIAFPAISAAEPSLEYAPEAEAHFLERCMQAGGSSTACIQLMERLQAQLGYPAFIARASEGPEGFGRSASEPTMASAGQTR